MNINISLSPIRRISAGALLGGLAIFCAVLVGGQSIEQISFPTPEAATTALVSAVRGSQTERAYAILGPEMKEALSGRDKQLAKFERDLFLMAADRKVKIVRDDTNKDRAIAYFGEQEWPFPAPLVMKNGKWVFDSAAGRQEMEDRTIGRQELEAIAACVAYVDAQFEYFTTDWNDDGVLQFAQSLISKPGKKNGLYWRNDHGEPMSPLGPFFVPTKDDPKSYGGYSYKILTRQGAAARGGQRDYMVDGRLLMGFALVAWPVDYGRSGVSTFVVNQLGQVFERDLGPQTAELAKEIQEFNPDSSWTKIDLNDKDYDASN
jgi:hypothetical protein